MSVYSILAADVPVTAVTTSIHVGQAPQDTSPPYIVLDFVTITPDNLLSDRPVMDSQRIGIDCVGGDQKASIDLYDLCVTALELDGHVITTNLYGERDKETGFYRTLFDFSYWQSRS